MLGAKTPNEAMIKFGGLPVVPIKTRKDHTCAECEDYIKRNRFAYRSATNAEREKRWCLRCVQAKGTVHT